MAVVRFSAICGYFRLFVCTVHPLLPCSTTSDVLQLIIGSQEQGDQLDKQYLTKVPKWVSISSKPVVYREPDPDVHGSTALVKFNRDRFHQ